MDYEISERLALLRKQNNLSQEALAEKMELSRQAISKWERGESAPDTDNLIRLASLYGITLDELLHGEKEVIIADETEEVFAEKKNKKEKKTKKEKQPFLYPQARKVLLKIPVFIIAPILFLCLGLLLKLWSTAWVVLLILPIYYGLCFAFSARSKRSFFKRLPVFLLTVCIFLVLGVFGSLWHPGWMVFLINPIYYWVVLMTVKK